MATNHDDDAPPAESEARTTPDPAPEPPADKPAKPSPDRPAKPAAAKPTRPAAPKPGAPKPAAKPPVPAAKEGKPAADKPVKPAGEKPARPAADKAPPVLTLPEKRAKPPAPKAKTPADESDEETAPVGEKEGAGDDGDKEEKAADEAAVQTEAAVKGKKKAKAKAKTETGIATKPGRSFFSFSKAAPTGVWGVDLGQCALKAIRLEIIEGEVTATAFDYVEHPKILSQPDADPDELTREALQKFLSRNVLRGDSVAISVPGQSGLARFVKLPPVEEKKIPDIVRFEAKQQIPFNLDEVVWDYQKLGVGELAAGFVETEIGLFAMKRDMVNRYLQHFKDVGVEVHLVQMAPLALCNFVAYDLLGCESAAAASDAEGRAKKHCVSALDIGADSSNLVITDGARIIWQRPIPLGGNHFTRALTKDLKLTFAKAEHLKRNAVKSPDLKKILASLKPVLSDFVGEVQRSLSYFTNTHRDAQIEYMIGLGNAFRLPGLQRFLSEKLQMDVRKLGKMERLTGDGVVASATYTENILSFAVAYGLALQGLKRTKLQTNLLPGEIRAERAVRGKKPWAIAAAALLLLGLGGFALTGYCNLNSYASESVVAAAKNVTDVAGRAKTAQDTFDQTKNAALKEEEAVKSIIAGQAERKNWLEITHYLFADALPRPDGSNLSPDAQKKYYDDGHGKEAFEDLKRRWQGQLGGGAKDASGKPSDSGDELDASVDNLIQVDIDFFDQRYCDDLGAAWKQIKETAPLIKGDDGALKTYTRTGDLDKPPDGKKGWLVEVHGTTYHKDADAFLADTLVENIYRLSVKPGSPPASTTPPMGAPPPPPPNGTPPPPAGAPAAPAKTEPPSDKDVYLNRISNVVLFDINQGKGTSIVGKSVLDELLPKTGGGALGGMSNGSAGGQLAPVGGAGGPAPAGGPPPGGSNGPGPGAPPAPGAPGAPAAGAPSGAPAVTIIPRVWEPLSDFMKSSKSGGLGSLGNPQAPPGFGEAKPKPAGASNHTKTEFVIVFFWREDTPSDILRGEDPNAKPPAPPTTGSPMGQPPMGQPPMGQPPMGQTPGEDKPLSPRSDLGP